MDYYIGQRVEALWDPQNEPNVYHGAKIRATGRHTLDIKYDDGYHWNGIKTEYVRVLGRRDYGTDGVDDAPPNPRARRPEEEIAPTTLSTTTPSAVEGDGAAAPTGRKRKAPTGDEGLPRTNGQTPFPTKLRALLEEPKHADVVVWRASTQSICVLDKPALCKILRSFKKKAPFTSDLKKSWDSFVQQLNRYGFYNFGPGQGRNHFFNKTLPNEYSLYGDPTITSPSDFSRLFHRGRLDEPPPPPSPRAGDCDDQSDDSDRDDEEVTFSTEPCADWKAAFEKMEVPVPKPSRPKATRATSRSTPAVTPDKSGYVYVLGDIDSEGRVKIGCGYYIKNEIKAANRWYFGSTRLLAHSAIFPEKLVGERQMHALWKRFRINPENEGFRVKDRAVLKAICAAVSDLRP